MKIPIRVTVEFDRIVVVEANSVEEAVAKVSNDDDIQEWIQADIAADPSDALFTKVVPKNLAQKTKPTEN